MKELRAISCVLTLSTLCLLGYGATLPGRAAGTRPAITITQPVHGAVVQGNVTVSVAYRSASSINVTHLEFYIDKSLYKATKLASPSTEGTYSFVWDPRGLAAGIHSITAIAYDAKGNPGDVAVSIYLDNQPGAPDVQAPSVSVANPRAGQSVSGVTQIMAQAIDNVGVKMVMFFLNKRLAYGTNHPPYRYAWDTTKSPNGTYSIDVYAYDAQDNKGESAPVTVKVDNPSGRTLPNERLSTAAPTATPAPAAAGSASVSPMRDVQATRLAPAPAEQLPPSARTNRGELPTLPLPEAIARQTGRPLLSQPAPQVAAQPQMDVTITSAKPSLAQSASERPAERRDPVAIKPALSKPIVGIAAAPASDMLIGTRYLQSYNSTFRPAGSTAVQPAASNARPSVSARLRQDSVVTMMRYLQSTGSTFAPSAASLATPAAASLGNPVLSSVTGAHPSADIATPVRVAASPSFTGAQSRIPTPSGSGAPSLDPAHPTPQVIALATSGTDLELAPSAGQMRLSAPADRLAPPAVSGAHGKAPAVMIALVDRQSRRAVPVAMLTTRDSEPSAARKELPASSMKPAPVKQLILTRKGKGTVAIVYNGRPVHFDDVAPFSRRGMTLTPFRQIFEHTGGSVLWNNLIKQVKASGDGHKVVFTIGTTQALVNDKTVQMQSAPFLMDGRAIVPLSFVRDALGVTVDYDPATGRITIAAK